VSPAKSSAPSRGAISQSGHHRGDSINSEASSQFTQAAQSSTFSLNYPSGPPTPIRDRSISGAQSPTYCVSGGNQVPTSKARKWFHDTRAFFEDLG
jgi:hypothetical protein